jgi:hypothetical protein
MPEFKYEIGEKVFYTNCYGVQWGNFIITGREFWSGERYGPVAKYYLDLKSAPWSPVDEAHLSAPRP